jgi:hypothetical protein
MEATDVINLYELSRENHSALLSNIRVFVQFQLKASPSMWSILESP